MDINTHIAQRLRALRDERGWTLAELAERSRVGRSTISLIERGESSATATILDRLCAALGVTLASLFQQHQAAPSPVSRAAEQVTWTDPQSGYLRRNLSPDTWSPLQLVEVEFPAGQSVAYDHIPRDNDVHQQIWLIEGVMEVSLGVQTWRLERGDCLAMQLTDTTRFHNPGQKRARYLLALSRH